MEASALKLKDNVRAEKVAKVLEPLILGREVVSRIISIFEQQLELGLVYSLEKSSLQMENTFVPELTDGTESGRFLALDLGGTNFR